MDIKNLRDVYNNISKTPVNQEVRVHKPITQTNNDLLDKVMDHLSQTPKLTPKVK